MKKILYITAFCALSILINSAYAEESKPFSGEVKLTGKLVDVNGNEAKFNEYRDLKDGVYGDIRLKYDNDRYFMKLSAGDIAYDTQNYKLEGGMWGKFKVYFKYNEIPHNITYDARTIFSGAGSSSLTTGSRFIFATPSTYTPTNPFDYSVERQQFEAGVKLDVLKPFYFDVSYAREERDGIKPAGVALTTGGGSYFVELPEPVDYVTNSLKAEIGYAKNPIFLSAAYLYSEFSNDNQQLFFTNPFNATTFNANRNDYLTLPPDNKYHNFSIKGSVKLPLYSILNVNFARSETKSDYDLLGYYIRNIAAGANVDVLSAGVQGVRLTDTSFDGKLTATNYAFVLTSRPVGFLGAKVFYKYYDKENKSDEIGHTEAGLNNGNQFFNHLFDYNKRSYGAEFDIKLPAKFTLTPAYTHVTTKRKRTDLPETNDDVYSVALRWSGVDFMTAKIAYERLSRSAGKERTITLFGTDQAAADVVEPFVRRFDAAPMDRDTYKASVDIYPWETVGIGLHYKNMRSDYRDTVLGLKDDKTSEYGIDADWRISSRVAVNGYVEYEKTKSQQVQQFSNNTAGLNPGVPDTTNNHTWKETKKNKTYDYGAGVEVNAIPNKLTFKLQFDYIKSDGSADFTFFDFTPAGSADISNVEDYRKTAFSLKTKYAVKKNLILTAGYAYEKYTYRDIALDGYLYAYGTVDTSISSLTGAYSAPSYKANIVFLGAAYKF